LLGPVYSHARTVSDRDVILSAREAGATTGLREVTASLPAALVASCAARLLHAVTVLEPGPRHLFGALQSLPVPSDPYGQLWRASELVREHRGDGHLAACVAAGLDMVEMNVLTEVWLGYGVGEYSATRGFDEDSRNGAVARLRTRGWMDDSGRLTETGAAARVAIEDATDRSQSALIDHLVTAADGRSGFERLIDDLQQVNAAVLAGQAAPADPRKRAAG
jgi:hypothetical protein